MFFSTIFCYFVIRLCNCISYGSKFPHFVFRFLMTVRDWDKSIIQTHTTLPLSVEHGCATNKNFRRGKIKYQEHFEWLISAKFPCRQLEYTLNELPQSLIDNLHVLMIIQGVHFLLSGNHFGSNWSYHGQPHLLHLSCSHLQKDTKERHNCSGYSFLLTDHLLTTYVSLPTLLIRHASFLSIY